MEIALLIAMAALVWFWLDSMHTHDLAVTAGKQAAEQHGLQFLDDTVAFSKLRAGRDASGRVKLKRTYRFEVSDTGADRLICSVTLLGHRIDSTDMPPYRDNVVQLF
jgi:hypothetical protein